MRYTIGWFRVLVALLNITHLSQCKRVRWRRWPISLSSLGVLQLLGIFECCAQFACPSVSAWPAWWWGRYNRRSLKPTRNSSKLQYVAMLTTDTVLHSFTAASYVQFQIQHVGRWCTTDHSLVWLPRSLAHHPSLDGPGKHLPTAAALGWIPTSQVPTPQWNVTPGTDVKWCDVNMACQHGMSTHPDPSGLYLTFFHCSRQGRSQILQWLIAGCPSFGQGRPRPRGGRSGCGSIRPSKEMNRIDSKWLEWLRIIQFSFNSTVGIWRSTYI